MGKMNKIMAEWTMLWATLLFAMLASCSSDSSVAGILIETNTGNKVLIETNTGHGMARVMISVDDFGISEGDTLQLSRTERDTVGDTIHITSYYTEDVVNAIDMALGYVSMDSIPALDYDSLTIVPVVGESRSIAMDVIAEEGVTYRIDSVGVAVDSSVAEIVQVALELPEGFEDLSSVDEIFKDMPFSIRVEKAVNSPCLVDANGGIVMLEGSASDSLLYWGRMDQVIFAKDGTVKFDLLNNCTRYKDSVTLARHVNHFDDLDESIVAERFSGQKNVLGGNALWLDSTDSWKMIEDFEPFTNNGTQMSASIWIKMKAEEQVEDYTRILSAKNDKVGFAVQQRADRTAINLRIDAGEEHYNQIFGTAEALDGTWHNYAFRINKDSVTIFLDGMLIQKAAYESGDGFEGVVNPTIGADRPNLVGGLDEIFFFDGNQSENWLRLFYALQKQASVDLE